MKLDRGSHLAGHNEIYHRSEDPSQNDIQQDSGANANTRHLEHGDGIALLGHPCESGGAALQIRAERGEDIIL